MDSFESLLTFEPYSLNHIDKDRLFKKALFDNFSHHYKNCAPYQKLCNKRGWSLSTDENFKLEDFPFLPVEIFRDMHLSSVSSENIVRTLQSSATSGQTPSSVPLDNETRKRQMKTLIWFLSNRLGKKRRPFVVMDVDPKDIKTEQPTISARAAAVRGFMTAASSQKYCMSEDTSGEMHLDLQRLESALETAQTSGEQAVIFGYTYVLYIYAAKKLEEKGVKFDLSNTTILHLGGWKKLQSQATDKATFNQTMTNVFGVKEENIIDCYGFTEQLGVVYLDGEDGIKRTSTVSEIIVRDPLTLLPCKDGDEGILEFLTPLPLSYPGNAILTDDVGRIISRNKGNDGRQGTAFEILGRRKKAEIRGCGDILSENMNTIERKI